MVWTHPFCVTWEGTIFWYRDGEAGVRSLQEYGPEVSAGQAPSGRRRVAWPRGRILMIRVLEIQKRKRKMISQAFNEKENKTRETRMAELNMLLSGHEES